MISYKRVLKNIAKKYHLDPDEILIMLWDHSQSKFDYLKNENSIVKTKDINFLKILVSKEIRYKEKYSKPQIKEVSVGLIFKDFNFSSIGKAIHPIQFISREEVKKIYDELIIDFSEGKDPISPAGVKDENLLNSALFHMQTSYNGNYKYPTLESSAAALMYSLSNNHPFHNGNKRTAIVSMLVFLDRHNMTLSCSEDDLFKISIKVADHKLVEEKYKYADAEIFELARWIHENGRIMKKGERQITLKKFRQILLHFDCELLDNGKVVRTIEVKTFGLVRDKKLISKKSIGSTISDGSEVDKALIKSIRDDLNLTNEHGIDSEIFYEKANYTSSDFIIKYKNLLKRLARV